MRGFLLHVVDIMSIRTRWCKLHLSMYQNLVDGGSPPIHCGQEKMTTA